MTALWIAWIFIAVPWKDTTTATSELAGDGGSLTLTLKVVSAGRDPCVKWDASAWGHFSNIFHLLRTAFQQQNNSPALSGAFLRPTSSLHALTYFSAHTTIL